MALNLAEHNFTSLIPAIVESIRSSLRPRSPSLQTCRATPTTSSATFTCSSRYSRICSITPAATPRHRINVTFTSREGSNELLVEDDGPGIPPAERGRVFQSFVQLNPAAGKKVGYGLGLAIVKRALEWHGGQVHIGESALGGALVRAQLAGGPVRHPMMA